MAKRVLIILAVIAALTFAGIVLGLHYVPSPFASVASHGETVVATIRSDLNFVVFRRGNPNVEHIYGSQSIELRDGESLQLQSPSRSYVITCRSARLPAGVYLEGEWHIHDFPRSAIKRWFIEAR